MRFWRSANHHFAPWDAACLMNVQVFEETRGQRHVSIWKAEVFPDGGLVGFLEGGEEGKVLGCVG